MTAHKGQSMSERKAKAKKDLAENYCHCTRVIFIVFVKLVYRNDDLEWKQGQQLKNVTQLKGKTIADQKAQLHCQL